MTSVLADRVNGGSIMSKPIITEAGLKAAGRKFWEQTKLLRVVRDTSWEDLSPVRRIQLTEEAQTIVAAAFPGGVPVLVADEKNARNALHVAFMVMHEQPPEDEILEHMVGVVLEMAYPEVLMVEAVFDATCLVTDSCPDTGYSGGELAAFELSATAPPLAEELGSNPKHLDARRIALLKEAKKR